jgi:hypothetical protein
VTINVKYLTEAAIDKEAESLLSEYEETIGEPIKLPVPIVDITTYHLALRLEFADLHKKFNVPMLRDEPHILGAIFVDERRVVIDQRLDPKGDLYDKLGRYNFTVAHEVGHWWLHRSYAAKDPNKTSLLNTEPTVICRSSEKNERIELQANLFASCLLMPRRRVLDDWNDFLKGRRRSPLEVGPLLGMRSVDRFGVSVQAMRIRLEKLGLLPRQNQSKATPRVGV